jgi:hypothetical protein
MPAAQSHTPGMSSLCERLVRENHRTQSYAAAPIGRGKGNFRGRASRGQQAPSVGVRSTQTTEVRELWDAVSCKEFR